MTICNFVCFGYTSMTLASFRGGGGGGGGDETLGVELALLKGENRFLVVS